MKYKLTQSGDYLVIADNSEIQINDIVLEEHIDGTYGIYQIDNINDIDKHTQRKIIAHLPPTKSSMIKGIDILPDLPENNKEIPIAFECIMETARIPYGDDGWKTIETGVKKATNSKGEKMLLGLYIYN